MMNEPYTAQDHVTFLYIIHLGRIYTLGLILALRLYLNYILHFYFCYYQD